MRSNKPIEDGLAVPMCFFARYLTAALCERKPNKRRRFE